MTKGEIKDYIAATGISLEGNIGPLMSSIMKDLKGRAEGSLVREALTEMMNEN